MRDLPHAIMEASPAVRHFLTRLASASTGSYCSVRTIYAPRSAGPPFCTETRSMEIPVVAESCESPLYTSQFRAHLSSAGVTPLRLPANSHNLNAYAERFVRSIRSECLSKLVLLGQGYLRAAIREYLVHYHEERNIKAWTASSSCRPPTSTGPDRSSAGSALAGSCASTSTRRPKTPRSSFCTLRERESIRDKFFTEDSTRMVFSNRGPMR